MNVVKEAFDCILQISLKNNVSLRLLTCILYSVVEKFNSIEKVELTDEEKDIVEKIANDFVSRLVKNIPVKVLN
jgi:hypothetical protein